SSRPTASYGTAQVPARNGRSAAALSCGRCSGSARTSHGQIARPDGPCPRSSPPWVGREGPYHPPPGLDRTGELCASLRPLRADRGTFRPQPGLSKASDRVTHPDVRLDVPARVLLAVDLDGDERVFDDVAAGVRKGHAGPLLPLCDGSVHDQRPGTHAENLGAETLVHAEPA